MWKNISTKLCILALTKINFSKGFISTSAILFLNYQERDVFYRRRHSIGITCILRLLSLWVLLRKVIMQPSK